MSFVDGADCGALWDGLGDAAPAAGPPPSAADFLAVFPEFTAVPLARVNFYLSLAVASLRPSFWQDRYQQGVMLYVAHMLAMAPAAATATAASPLSVGAVTGIVTSKSVGGVSKSSDVNMGSTDGGGVFNTTVYGRTYLELRDSGSIGALQL